MTVRVRLSTGNVNSGFRSTTAYRAAIPGMVRVFNKTRSTVRFINEAGDRDDSTRLCDAFGDDWRYTREHGTDSRLSSAIHFDSTKHQLIESGRWDISSVVTHDTAAWGLFRTGDVFWFGVTALMWPFPIGPNNTKKDDKIRSDATKSMLRQSREYCTDAAQDHGVEHIPIIAGGDMNHAASDKPDVIGMAFDSHDLTDTDRSAIKQINGDKSTHAKPGGLHKGISGRIDRIAVDDTGVSCLEQNTVWGYPSLDHNPVVVSLDITNSK